MHTHRIVLRPAALALVVLIWPLHTGCFPDPDRMREDDAHDSTASSDTAADGPDSISDVMSDDDARGDTMTGEVADGDGELSDLSTGDSGAGDGSSEPDLDVSDGSGDQQDGTWTEDGLGDDVDASEPGDSVADDTTEPDAVSDTSSPRCPGGSVSFEWGSAVGQTIDIEDSITVSEYLEEERRSKTYACPDDFFDASSDDPRWDSPVVVSWHQPLGTSTAWRDLSVAFNSAATLWDFLTQDGQAAADLTRLPSGRLRVTSSTGATRTLELSYLRPRSLQSYPGESPPYELLAFEANESPDHGFKLDIIGVGQGIRAQYISLRIEPNTEFSPEIRFPGQWDNAWYSRAAGQLRIHNGCDTAGTRVFFGRRDLWTWYASGRTEKKNMSIRFMGPDGSELRRLNVYNALPAAYGPSFDDCTSEEVIVLDFELIENG